MTEESPQEPSVERKRRTRLKGGRSGRHNVRTSAEEEGQLQRLALAQHVSVPRYLVESALAQGAGETITERRATIAKLFELHRLLAAISNNVNQIAKVTNSTGQRQAETAAALEAVRRTAERIDAVVDELSLS